MGTCFSDFDGDLEFLLRYFRLFLDGLAGFFSEKNKHLQLQNRGETGLRGIYYIYFI